MGLSDSSAITIKARREKRSLIGIADVAPYCPDACTIGMSPAVAIDACQVPAISPGPSSPQREIGPQFPHAAGVSSMAVAMNDPPRPTIAATFSIPFSGYLSRDGEAERPLPILAEHRVRAAMALRRWR